MTAPVDYEELERLLAAATPGPWVAFDKGRTQAIMKGRRPPLKENGYPVRPWPEIVTWSGFDGADTTFQKRRANLHLIVAAVNALPTLLAERKRERAEGLTYADGIEAAARVAIHHSNYGHVEGNKRAFTIASDLERRVAAIRALASPREGEG